MKIRFTAMLLMLALHVAAWAINPQEKQQREKDLLLQEQTKAVIAELKQRQENYLQELKMNAEKRQRIIELSKRIDAEREKLAKQGKEQKHDGKYAAMQKRSQASIMAWQKEISSIRLTDPNKSRNLIAPSRSKAAKPMMAKAKKAAPMSQEKHAHVERIIDDSGTTYNYKYNNRGQIVEYQSKDSYSTYRYTLAYDNEGNCTTKVTENLQTNSEDGSKYWQPMTMINNAYDALGNETMSAEYRYADGKWTGYSKSERFYDNHGYYTGSAYYGWDSEAKAWYVTSYSKSTYDDNDNLIESVSYSTYYGYSGSKTVYEYAEGNILMGKYRYEMNEDGEWVLKEQTVSQMGEYGLAKTEYYDTEYGESEMSLKREVIYLYDEDGNHTGEEVYVKANGRLVGESKSESFYSDSKILNVDYEWVNNQWAVTYYSLTTYDVNGNETYHEDYYVNEGVKNYGYKTEYEITKEGDNIRRIELRYEIAEGEWKLQTKNEVLYDSQGRELEVIRYIDNYEEGLRPYDKNAYTYDADGVKSYSYYWAADQNDWILSYAYGERYTYDESGCLVKKTDITLDGEEWIDTGDYEEYTYNEKGEVVSETYINYWSKDRYEYEYDEWGNIIHSVEFNYVDGEWQKIGHEYRYQYNAAGKCLLTERFDWMDGLLTGGYYSHEEYDDHDALTLYERYESYDDGHWGLGSKRIYSYIYTEDDEQIETLYESYDVLSSGELRGYTKRSASYDDLGNLLSKYSYSGWDEAASDFIMTDMEVYDRRPDGQVLSYEKATFANGVKTGKSKYQNTYDDNGNLTERIEYRWNTTYKDWVNNYRYTYVWDEYGNVVEYAYYYISSNTWRQSYKYTLTYDTSIAFDDVCGKEEVNRYRNSDITMKSAPLTKKNSNSSRTTQFIYSECEHHDVDDTLGSDGLIHADKTGTYTAENGMQMHVLDDVALLVGTFVSNLQLSIDNPGAVLNVVSAGEVLYTGVPEGVVSVAAPLGVTEITLTDAESNIIPLTGLAWNSGEETIDQAFMAKVKEFRELLEQAVEGSKTYTLYGQAAFESCLADMQTYSDNGCRSTNPELTDMEMLEQQYQALLDAMKAWAESSEIAFDDEVELLKQATDGKGYVIYTVEFSHIDYVNIAECGYDEFPYDLLKLPYVTYIHAIGNSISEFEIPEGDEYNRDCEVSLRNQKLDGHINLTAKDWMDNPLNVWQQLPQVMRILQNDWDTSLSMTISNTLDTNVSNYSAVSYWLSDYSDSSAEPYHYLYCNASSGALSISNGQECYLTTDVNNMSSGTYIRAKFTFDEGDSNLDGAVDVADIQTVINYIIRNSLYTKTYINIPSADRNKDNNINVLDIVGITNDILADAPAKAKGARPEVQTAVDAVGKSTVYVENGTLYVNATEPVASFDIQMATADGVKWLSCLDGFTITSRNGRTVAYNLDGKTLPAGVTAVATVGSGKPVVLAAKLVSAEAKTIPCVVTGTATGINNVCTDDADNTYYNTAGQRISSAQRGLSIIKTNNNITKKIAR